MTKLNRLGRYNIIREIGRGGMSTVYLAHDPIFDRDVALKILPREFLHDPTFIARFEREAKAIASMEHAAIVPVYDFGEEEGQPFLVLRYMPGGSLSDRLRDGRLSIEDAIGIITRLARALHEAHNRGMIHRDIKPGNVLFDQYGDAFLTDFGIVKLTQETSTFTGGAVIGTPAYMSPEQARGDRDIDSRSDVYALGSMLFEMLTGRPPYVSETFIGLAIKHINDPVPSMLNIQPDLPPILDEIIQKAMSKDRENRYQTAQELVKALQDVLKTGRETVIADPIPPKNVVEQYETKATLIGTPPEETELEERETVIEMPEKVMEAPQKVLKTPTPKFQRKTFKLPKWIFALVGVVILAILSGILIPPMIKSPTPEPSATSISLAVSNTVTPQAQEKTQPPQPHPTMHMPPVVGPDPSPLVGAFYYPWYGNPDLDGEWIHWGGPDLAPPLDISSDYYPLLGPYSSLDQSVVAQHFAWLRQAGIGFIISSWWGQGSYEDNAIPLLLNMGARYGIKVAFHIEAYEGRSADQLVADIGYLYERYGDHPAFYRTAASSLWSQDDRQKGLFFLWNTSEPFAEEGPIIFQYWQAAMDAIHGLPDGGIVIANAVDSSWIYESHFDGIYNYTALDHNFAFAQSIPMGAWYVPSFIPGFSAKRIGYPEDLYLPRNHGETYDTQWRTVLTSGLQPQLVTITSFNEWHEGTQIEPALPEFKTDQNRTYDDYRPLEPEDYLFLTHEHVNQFKNMEWPAAYRVQIHMTTTSDWTDLWLIEGGRMMRPYNQEVSEASPSGGFLWDHIFLEQELGRAEAGGAVELTVDFLLTNLDPDGTLVFRLVRGHLGMTEVRLKNYLTDEPILVDTFLWAGINEQGENGLNFEVPAALITEPPSS